MVSGKFFQTLIFCAVFALAAVSLSAQAAREKPVTPEKDDGFGIYIIKTEDGYLIVNNRATDSYSLEFKGEKFKAHENEHPVFTIDDKLVQVLSVARDNFWQKPNPQKAPTDDELLEAHKIWERDYLAGELESKLSVTSEIFSIERRRKVMYWSFPMPKTLESDFSHQIFLTTLIGRDVLGINASPKSAGEQKAYRDYLVESMNTLKISSKPFNIKELQMLLKKGDSVD